jgi:hypothetical protein
MIKVSGSARRSFVFPAALPLAYAYYADIGRVLSYLPHICLVRAYSPDRLRLLYRSTELGIYHVRIFADVKTSLTDGRILSIHPMDDIPPVKAAADIHSMAAQGCYSSKSVFHAEGSQTRIEYHLQLQANLPTPLGLHFMPSLVVNRIAGSITRMRIREIVEGFIDRSTDAFPYWLAELQNHGFLPEPGSVPAPSPPVPDCPEEHP